MKIRKAVAGVLLLLLCMHLAPASAFSCEKVSMRGPADTLAPGESISMECTVSFGDATFPERHTLMFLTELEHPEWTFSLYVDGEELLAQSEAEAELILPGALLSFGGAEEVRLNIHINGSAPEVASQSRIAILSATEYDQNGEVLSSACRFDLPFSGRVIPDTSAPPVQISDVSHEEGGTRTAGGFLLAPALLAILAILTLYRHRR